MTTPAPHPATKALTELQALREFGKHSSVSDSHVHADQILCNLLTELGHGKVVQEYAKIWRKY